ncbi:MAG: arsenite methyltransferase [Candidatus Marinimicrobia bacterium]|nr:arsenite methyltransferase [Candidatus Neomarinimicrobiota bacterium]MCF7840931.1 arsenite methyltransferase [Candidatus Neomarinimicrobiota bacterium]
MSSSNELKKVVQDKYAEIAKDSSGGGCCGPVSSCCGESGTDGFTMIGDAYDNVSGHVVEADLGLGCGLPTQFAGITAGDTVVDLGSGAGNDVFIARSLVGDSGNVIGIDMTPEMIQRAEVNNRKLSYENVEFRLGDIEALPLDADVADVVVSNCVLNLVPDKAQAFTEIFRVLKPGGHFCISDIVIQGELSPELQKSAELYAGCVSGALEQEKYLAHIRAAGFEAVEIKQSRQIDLPAELLEKYLSPQGRADYVQKLQGIFSITVVGVKPTAN